MTAERAQAVRRALFFAASLSFAAGVLLWRDAASSAESVQRRQHEVAERLAADGEAAVLFLGPPSPDRGPATIAWVLGGLSLTAGVIVVRTSRDE